MSAKTTSDEGTNMETTMPAVATKTYCIEFLFNDSTNWIKRDELSPTAHIPHEFLKDFAMGDLVDLAGLEEDEAEKLYDEMLREIEETEAICVTKEFPSKATFTIKVEDSD